MAIDLIDVLLKGGCYWKEKENGQGFSFVVPNNTPFKIALEGEQSHRYIGGKCEDGWFVILEGGCAGKKFPSANQAVSAVRPIPSKSNNAFLYIQFKLDGEWIKADRLRHENKFRLNPSEEYALDIAKTEIRNRLKMVGKSFNAVELLCKAAEVVRKNPRLLESCRSLDSV